MQGIWWMSRCNSSGSSSAREGVHPSKLLWACSKWKGASRWLALLLSGYTKALLRGNYSVLARDHYSLMERDLHGLA